MRLGAIAPTRVGANLSAALCVSVLGLGFGTGCSLGNGPVAERELDARGAYAAALAHDGRDLVIGHRGEGISLRSLDSAATGHDLTYRNDRTDRLVAAAFDPTDDWLITATRDLVVVWARAGATVVRAWIPPNTPTDVALAGDGTRTLLAMQLPTAAFFDARSGRLIHQLHHDDIVVAVAMDRQARWGLTGTEDGTASLWDLQSGTEIRRWQHDSPVHTLALSPDGRLALTAASSGRVVLWDAESGRPLKELFRRNPGLTSARFAADGSQLLTGTSDLEVQLWDTRTGARLKTWSGRRLNHWRPDGEALLDVAFLQGGRRVAAVAENGLGFEFEP